MIGSPGYNAREFAFAWEFLEKLLHSRLGHAFAIYGAGRTGNHGYRKSFELRPRLEPGNDVEAVDQRHMEIEQKQTGVGRFTRRNFLENSDQLLAIAKYHQRVLYACFSQAMLDQKQIVRLVVRDKYGWGWGQ